MPRAPVGDTGAPASARLDLGELRDLSLEFQKASRRIEEQISNRIEIGAFPHAPHFSDLASFPMEDEQ